MGLAFYFGVGGLVLFRAWRVWRRTRAPRAP
jgi:hypothetical protein